MFNKLFSSRKRKPPRNVRTGDDEKFSSSSPSVLKIIHAGGAIECYYMAVPAARIMQKYPSFVLARPDVFRRPWDSVVQPDEILVPGQKFFVVPVGTVKKLRRRIRKPVVTDSFVGHRIISDVSDESVSTERDELSSKTFLVKGGEMLSKSIIRTLKSKGKGNARVRFEGVVDRKSNDDYSMSMEKKSLKGKVDNGERKRRVRNGETTWEPSLTVIAETNASDHE